MIANKFCKRRTSRLWQFFKRVSPGFAKCCICRKVLSFKSSITNLKRHLDIKHGGVFEEMLEKCTYASKDKDTSVSLLTALVEMQPCLWDTRCETYGNVELQNKAWNTIAARMCPNTDQSEAVKKLSEEFNGLRNGFFSNPGSSYGQFLSFMAPLRDDTNSLHSQSTDIHVKQELSESRDIVSLVPQEKEDGHDSLHTTNEDLNDSLIQNKESNTSTQQVFVEEPKSRMHADIRPTAQIKCDLQLNHVDDNTLFLLSLVDNMKTVPREYQMSFKTDLIVAFSELVNKYTNMK